MLELDVRTIIGCVALVNVVSALVLVLLQRQNLPLPGIDFWAAGMVLGAASQVLFLVRGVAPDVLSVVVANLFLVAGFALLWIGAADFRGFPLPWENAGFVVLTLALPLVWYTQVVPDGGTRILFMSAGMAALSLAVAWTLFRDLGPGEGGSPGRVLSGGAIGLMGVLSLLRVPAQLTTPAAAPYFDSWHTLVVYGCTLGLTVAWTGGLLLMVSERLHEAMEVERAAALREVEIGGGEVPAPETPPREVLGLVTEDSPGPR